ncbi:MAG: 30S ribosomal protein S17 [Pseudomonadota bacterium]
MSLEQKQNSKVISGIILKISPCKTTLNISSSRRKNIRKFNTTIKVKKQYAVHNDKFNDLNIGDEVGFIQCPPKSKTKRWKCIEIQKRGKI